MFYLIDILGTIAFAISGVLVAINKKMDLFGIFIIAFVTAVGGGDFKGSTYWFHPGELDDGYDIYLCDFGFSRFCNHF